MLSESDYPFETICWDGEKPITPEHLRQVSGSPPDCPIEETDLGLFFQNSAGLQNVVGFIRDNLANVKVYKVGLINIPVYIVGRSPAGNWLGLATRVVQT
jgi:hypothetical protein